MPPPGQQPYLRGAAAVAPGQPRPGQPAYPYGKPAAAGRPGGRNGWLIFLAVILALTVVVCSGVIAYKIANRANDNNSSSQGPGSSGRGGAADTPATSGGAAAAAAHDIPCERYRWQKFDKVKDDLEEAEFQVVRRDVPGVGQGRVVDVAPCRAVPGAVVTVMVATGKPRTLASCPASKKPTDCLRDRDD
jgi:hypothetical protein